METFFLKYWSAPPPVWSLTVFTSLVAVCRSHWRWLYCDRLHGWLSTFSLPFLRLMLCSSNTLMKLSGKSPQRCLSNLLTFWLKSCLAVSKISQAYLHGFEQKLQKLISGCTFTTDKAVEPNILSWLPKTCNLSKHKNDYNLISFIAFVLKILYASATHCVRSVHKS